MYPLTPIALLLRPYDGQTPAPFAPVGICRHCLPISIAGLKSYGSADRPRPVHRYDRTVGEGAGNWHHPQKSSDFCSCRPSTFSAVVGSLNFLHDVLLLGSSTDQNDYLR